MREMCLNTTKALMFTGNFDDCFLGIDSVIKVLCIMFFEPIYMFIV